MWIFARGPVPTFRISISVLPNGYLWCHDWDESFRKDGWYFLVNNIYFYLDSQIWLFSSKSYIDFIYKTMSHLRYWCFTKNLFIPERNTLSGTKKYLCIFSERLTVFELIEVEAKCKSITEFTLFFNFN